MRAAGCKWPAISPWPAPLPPWPRHPPARGGTPRGRAPGIARRGAADALAGVGVVIAGNPHQSRPRCSSSRCAHSERASRAKQTCLLSRIETVWITPSLPESHLGTRLHIPVSRVFYPPASHDPRFRTSTRTYSPCNFLSAASGSGTSFAQAGEGTPSSPAPLGGLSVDPTLISMLDTSDMRAATKSAKRILQKLLFGSRTRASQCFIPVRETTKADNLIPMAEGVLKG
jgi:hypothetical protein